MSRTALDGAHSQHHDSLTNANFSTEPDIVLICPFGTERWQKQTANNLGLEIKYNVPFICLFRK